MTHHRDRFERVYALTEEVAPAQFICESGEPETDRFLSRRKSACGAVADSAVRVIVHGGVQSGPSREQRMLEGMLANGELIEVQVEGWKAIHHALGSDARTLRELSAGRIPKRGRH